MRRGSLCRPPPPPQANIQIAQTWKLLDWAAAQSCLWRIKQSGGMAPPGLGLASQYNGNSQSWFHAGWQWATRTAADTTTADTPHIYVVASLLKMWCILPLPDAQGNEVQSIKNTARYSNCDQI